MPTRIVKAPALVLKSRSVGEHHRGLSMLVSGEGLLTPLAFGAQSRKSALRGTALPYNNGIANLYFDGIRDRWRLTSFDLVDSHDGLRENLGRFGAATTWAEILLNTHGSGDNSADVFNLASMALSLLSDTESRDIGRLNAAFLWCFLVIEGVRPNLEHCGRCGGFLRGAHSVGLTRYLPDGVLLGPECSEESWPSLPDDALEWFANIELGNLETALRIALIPATVQAAENWLLTVMQTLLERPLRSVGVLR